MLFRLPTASAMPRWTLLAAMAPALTLLLVSSPGCLHRRQALRPAYVVPGATVETVVPDSCPPGASTVTPSAPSTPGFDESSVPSTLAPATPAAPSGSVNGGVRSPAPLPGAADEPELNVKDSRTPSSYVTPPAVPGTPQLQGPSSWNTKRRAAPRAALRTQLRQLANDPNDLFQPPKADRPWKYIVLHHSATPSGSYAEIDREHRQRKGWNGCGYHFVVGNGSGSPDGQIEVAKRWSDQKAGAHCRNGKTADINDYGIGICLVGDFDQSPASAKQIEATRVLIAYLRERYDIPANHVGTHAQLASSPTACPGKNFPTSALLGTRNLAMH